VAHLRAHPEQYRDALEHFMRLALPQLQPPAERAQAQVGQAPPPAEPKAGPAPSLRMAAAAARGPPAAAASRQAAGAGGLPVTLHRRGGGGAAQPAGSGKPPGSTSARAGVTTHSRVAVAAARAEVLAGSPAAQVLRCGPPCAPPAGAAAGVTVHRPVGVQGGAAALVSEGAAAPGGAAAGRPGLEARRVLDPAAVAAVYRSRVLAGQLRSVQGVALGGAVFAAAAAEEEGEEEGVGGGPGVWELSAAGRQVFRLPLHSKM
jgi:hypothetical protein